MLITTGNLKPDALDGLVAVVTGAGRGIGFETARSLVRLGAKVVIAELDAATGAAAAQAIQDELGAGTAVFVQTDVGSEESIAGLKAKARALYGRVDIVLNNATVTPMGAVKDRPIKDWDASYSVNLRGPVLLAQAFLPEMIARKQGVFVCVSSVGQAFMGAYESFKAAQSILQRRSTRNLRDQASLHLASGRGWFGRRAPRQALRSSRQCMGSRWKSSSR